MYRLTLFILFSVYSLAAVWGIYQNSRSKLNWLFFIICYGLAIWTISQSLSNSAPDYSTALFWRKICAFGWGSLYSLLIHYFLILTGKDKLLKNKSIYVVLYLPVIINLFVYTFYTPIASKQFNLTFTSLGWTNSTVDSIWNDFFNVYYISFSLFLVYLLLTLMLHDKIHRRQVLTFLLSFLFAFILGSVTDIWANRYLSATLPSLAPVFILFPIVVFAKGVKIFGIIDPISREKKTLPDEILSEREQIRVFTFTGIAYITGAYINLVYSFFYNTELYSVLRLSTGILFTGFIILLLPYLRISGRWRDNLFTGIIGFSIYYLMQIFMVPYGSHLIWPLPILFMTLAVVFNKPQLLYTVFIIALLSQITAWVRIPRLEITFSSVDHTIRLLIYLTGFALALYIRKTYISRLNEIQTQISFQKLLSHISTSLVTVTQDNLENRLQSILKKLSEYYGADQSVLVSFNRNKPENIESCSMWSRNGRTSDVMESIIKDSGFWGNHFYRDSEYFIIDDLHNQILFDEPLMKSIKMAGFEALITVQIKNQNDLLGYICFCFHSKQKKNTAESMRMLKMAINLLSDVLSKIAIEKKINHMAFYDNLTGLPNRSLFNDRVSTAIPLAKRENKIIAIMLLDLDSFKTINDTMGHLVGDFILKEVAQKLSASIREYDTVSRFGGDEFLFIFTQLGFVDDINSLAEKLLDELSEPISFEGKEYYIKGSIGIAVYPFDGTDAGTLIKNADLAMYASKKRGRNQYSFCSHDMKNAVREQHNITTDLNKALDNNEFELYYQPQVSTITHEIKGLEALIRWNHPERGVISPSDFIPLAEQSGLINPIGNWVLETACTQVMKLQKISSTPIRVAVNLSMKQFLSPGLMTHVSDTLRITGLPSELLELEITESIAMEDSGDVKHMMNCLKDLGVTISIDDFGTQYSSLSRLKDMPIDRLKIDKQFIDSIIAEKNDDAIAMFIINLSRNLGLNVIAEGVEDQHQYSYLLSKGCDEIQGFYFSKPLPVKKLKRLLQEGNVITP